MPDITLHIGLHKTGTSYLQRELFKKIPDTTVLEGNQTHRQLMSANPKNHILISDETLSGELFKGSYERDFYNKVERLADIYKTPKVILGIRNHRTFISSVYKQYLQEKGDKTIDYIFNINDTGLIHHQELFLEPKIRFLQEKFEKVFIYSQESLLAREADFIEALFKFLELDSSSLELTSGGKQSKKNVSVKSVAQVNALIKLNRVNKFLEGIHPGLSLYSKFIKRIRLSPRDISQSYLRKINSPSFSMSNDLKEFLDQHYSKDWDTVSKMTSY